MCMRTERWRSLSRHETPTREKKERAGQSRMGNKADRERAGQRGRGFSRQEFSDPRGSSHVLAGQGVVSLAPLNPDRGYVCTRMRARVGW